MTEESSSSLLSVPLLRHVISRPALALGLLFGWILSLPLAGPLLVRAQPPELGPLSAAEVFTLTHTLTLLLASLPFRRHLPATWTARLGAATALFGLALAVAPLSWWAPLLGLAGITAASGVLTVGEAITRLPPEGRPWAIASGAFLANLFLMLVSVLHGPRLDRWFAGTAALGLLALPWLLRPARRPAVARPALPWKKVGPLLPAVFGIYLVGGIMYAIVLPTLGPLGTALGVLPYLAFLPVAAWVTARQGRSWAVRIGPGMLGVGYVGWAILSGPVRDVLVQIFIVGSYAFFDVVFWTTFTDHAAGHRRLLGLGLGTMTLAILLGMMLTNPVALLAADQKVNAALIAAAAMVLVAATLPVLWPEPAPSTAHVRQAAPAPPKAPPPADAELLIAPATARALAHFGLTTREIEILELVARGFSNKEIATHLGLSIGTVRKHLENIYRKLGARSRVEVISRLNSFRRESEARASTSSSASPPPSPQLPSPQAMPPQSSASQPSQPPPSSPPPPPDAMPHR